MLDQREHGSDSWFHQRWLRWGLIVGGSYLTLGGFLLFVLAPLGMLLHWFGPIVPVGLLALLNWPVLFFPNYRNPGLDVGTLVLLQVPPTVVVYFLLGVGLGVIWPARPAENRGTKGLPLTVICCLLMLWLIFLIYQRVFTALPKPLPPVPIAHISQP